MVVTLTLLPLTMILGLPLMSACTDQPSAEDRFTGCTGDKFWVNVTRRNDGDALISSCPRCGDLCRQAKAVRLRCDLREYPCTCRCPYNQTFRTDINLCVDTFSACSFSASKPTSITLVDATKNNSASEHCRVRKTSVFKCGDWTNLESLNITQDRGIWTVAKETDSAGRNVWWTGSLDAFQSLSGYLLYLEISCDSNTASTSCTVVKMAGTRGYAVSTRSPAFPTARSDLSTEGSIPSWLVTSNGTAGNKTAVITDEEYKQLEMLVTAVCMSVALLLCVWLTCFAVEKRVQSKKRGSEKQYASQTRTYPHEVAHVRKTLMDVYDMPMIRFNMTGEDDEGSSVTMSQPKKKEKEATIAEVLPDHEADGEESTSPSSSELRTETGSSSSENLAVQTGFLGVPKNSDEQEFKHWRPCLKQQLTVGTSKKSPPLSPTKKKANPPGILKKSPNTSPTRSPTRSPPMPRRSPIKSILIKRSPTLHKRWKTAVTRHFQHPNQNHAGAAAPSGDGIEMKTVNGLNAEPQAPKRSILKHGSRWRALAPKLVPMEKAEELDDDLAWDRDDKKHQVVIKCEIHHEDERRETDPESDEKAYTERSPLTRSIKMVLEPRLDAPSKKNCIQWRCEDFDGVPCTDV